MASEDLVNLSLDGGEEEGFEFDFNEGEEEVEDLRWCLIGRFLCDRTIHVNSMMVRMANLWQPMKGVTIKEAKPGLFLFRFNHQLDMEEVLKNGPWTFDNHLLIVERVQIGVQIENIPLYHADFWVQIHGLPTGLMKEKVGSSLGNFIGSFMEYDKNNNSSFWRQYMRLRIKIDVRLPLKKDTKVKDRNGEWCTVKFKYEKLGIFCFVCGIMGHTENRCEIRFAMSNDDGQREWSSELRADTRRMAGRPVSRWLKEETGGGHSSRGGGASSDGVNSSGRQETGESSMQSPTSFNVTNYTVSNTIITKENSPINTIITSNCPVSQNNTPSHTQSLLNNSPLIPFQNVNSQDTNIQSHQPHIIFSADNTNTQAIPSVNQPKFNLNTSANSLLNNYYKQTNFPIHVNNNIITPAKKPGPTTIQNSSLTNQDMPRQPTTPNLDKFSSSIAKYPATQKISGRSTSTGSTLFPVIIEEVSDEAEDMDVQSERKRRREEENDKSSDLGEINQHFLSAGPGSQDCRGQ
ncbi:hypothetical protein A2U01_0000940 [Trifolium medium]|uniref:CCHC-type domain-containing protein n=1 Tax=Trifolium medium TaxID=97028 RepID=A0A392LYV3_9FABA|nr:hypothetical protein [Trifolium medium]